MRSERYLLGTLLALTAFRVWTLPQTIWELDEVLFTEAVKSFEPARGIPHPPGYPLLIGLGKLFGALFGDPFTGFVALALLAGSVGFIAFAVFARTVAREAGFEEGAAAPIGAAAALLFFGSPGFLVHGSLALSDPAALGFLAVALAASVHRENGSRKRGDLASIVLGAAAAAAIGCRPQLAVPLLPFLTVVLAFGRSWRRTWVTVTAFGLVCLAWFAPLVLAFDSWDAFWNMQSRQARFVATNDAAAARTGLDFESLVERFYVNAWGRRRFALPVFLLAMAGTWGVVARRVRAVLPLAVLVGVHAAFCWVAMDPADGPRYGLPVAFWVALAAALAVGAFAASATAARAQQLKAAWRRALPLAAAGAITLVGATYAWPLLRARSTMASPPTQALEALRAQLKPETVLLVQPPLLQHAKAAFGRNRVRTSDLGFDPWADKPRSEMLLLSDGPSEWPGGQSFSWPESHAYGELTRNLYQTVSISPIPPQRRYEAISGVEPFEPALARPRWRWLRQDATLRLHPDRARSVRLDFALGPEAPKRSFRVLLDGEAAALGALNPGESTRMVLALPATNAPTVDVRVLSDGSFLAAEGRPIALRLTGVELLDPPPVGETRR